MMGFRRTEGIIICGVMCGIMYGCTIHDVIHVFKTIWKSEAVEVIIQKVFDFNIYFRATFIYNSSTKGSGVRDESRTI